MIKIYVKDYGCMSFNLDRKNAPISCSNFVELAKSGFYDGTTFHRVIKGFMIQGGDPLGNGTGGPDYCIKGEFLANGVKNTLSHKRGVISMARAQDFDSAGSQFFIVHKNSEFLDGNYAAFGTIVSGEEVIDQIANVRTSPSDKPLKDVVIEKIEVIDEEVTPFEKLR